MAGRLGAIFGAPRFTPGFPADGFGGTSVAVLTTGFGVGFADAVFAAGFGAGLTAGFTAGFADAVFAAGFGAGFAGAVFAAGFGAGFAGAVFAAGFGAGFAGAVFAAGFGAGFAALFGAGFAGVGALKRRERMPFFSATGGHELHEIRNSAAVAPLVVIPSHYLGEVVAEQHGACGINDCGARVATEVRGDERLV